MTKRLVIKTGTYIKDGQEKGEYTRLGVMMDGDNGPYLLLDPCVNLAGCLTKQNMMNHGKGGKPRSSLMVSVFEEDGQQQRPQGQQQARPDPQAPPAGQKGGFDDEFDQEIPF